MLVIDNREEIQQLILNETGSPEATEGILTLLEKQESLSQIYDEYINVSNFGVINFKNYFFSVHDTDTR